MDRELWTLILSAVRRAAREVGWNGGRRPPRYPNRLVVAMYLWAVWHDRTMSWACDRSHYTGLFRPRGRLPSVSRFTRRVKSDDCQRILQLVHDEFAQRGLVTAEGYVDGKALLVGPVSKDRQATRGRVVLGRATRPPAGDKSIFRGDTRARLGSGFENARELRPLPAAHA